MGWPDCRVGVEYDGEHHWLDPATHAEDITRLEFLAARDWIIVRVSARHLRDREGILRRVRAALRSRMRTAGLAYTSVRRFFSASTSKSAAGHDMSRPFNASISSSRIARRLYHFRLHGTMCHGA